MLLPLLFKTCFCKMQRLELRILFCTTIWQECGRRFGRLTTFSRCVVSLSLTPMANQTVNCLHLQIFAGIAGFACKLSGVINSRCDSIRLKANVCRDKHPRGSQKTTTNVPNGQKIRFWLSNCMKQKTNKARMLDQVVCCS